MTSETPIAFDRDWYFNRPCGCMVKFPRESPHQLGTEKPFLCLVHTTGADRAELLAEARAARERAEAKGV